MRDAPHKWTSQGDSKKSADKWIRRRYADPKTENDQNGSRHRRRKKRNRVVEMREICKRMNFLVVKNVTNIF